MNALVDDFNIALKLTQDDQYDQAIAAYEKILEKNPDHAPSYYNLGQLYAKFGDSQKARECFEKMIALAPEFAPGYFQLAQVLLFENQALLAIEQLQVAVQLQADYIHAQHLLACTLMQQHQHDLAQVHFETVLRLDPMHASAHLNFALLKLKENQTEEAKALLDSALGLDPTLIEAHYHRGVIAMQQGDIEGAVLEMQETLDRQENHFAANYNLAILYKMQQHYQLAIHFFKKAQTLQPADAHIAFLLATLEASPCPARAPGTFVRELFDHYAEYYDEQMAGALHYQVPQSMRALFDAQQLSLPHNPIILDLGCGTGLVGKSFQDLNAQIIGIDLSDNMLAQAKKTSAYTQLQHIDILDYLQQETENTVDVIIAAEVLNYFGPLEEIFAHCTRILKPQGLLLFSIELTQAQDYQLQACARYAHSADYIMRVASEHHWLLLAEQTQTMRLQENKPVMGTIFLYQPSASECRG